MKKILLLMGLIAICELARGEPIYCECSVGTFHQYGFRVEYDGTKGNQWQTCYAELKNKWPETKTAKSRSCSWDPWS